MSGWNRWLPAAREALSFAQKHTGVLYNSERNSTGLTNYLDLCVCVCVCVCMCVCVCVCVATRANVNPASLKQRDAKRRSLQQIPVNVCVWRPSAMLQLKYEQLDKNWQNLNVADFLTENTFVFHYKHQMLVCPRKDMLFKETVHPKNKHACNELSLSNYLHVFPNLYDNLEEI